MLLSTVTEIQLLFKNTSFGVLNGVKCVVLVIDVIVVVRFTNNIYIIYISSLSQFLNINKQDKLLYSNPAFIKL